MFDRVRRQCLGLLLLACMTGSHAAPWLGVKVRPGCPGARQDVPAFEKWVGRRLDVALDFFSDVSWAHIRNVGWWAKCWAGSSVLPVFSLPMLPSGSMGDLDAGADGRFDAVFKDVARQLRAAGIRRAIIRPGWEFNGDWYAWRAQGRADTWVRYWIRIVEAMRSVPDLELLFDWCPNVGMQKIAPEEVYPGDQYVDIIGMDAYNNLAGIKDPRQRWRLLRDMPFGLAWHAGFAIKRGKPMSFPEWGTGLDVKGEGGGDDEYYVCQMAGWIKRHSRHVLYHAYWDERASFNARISDGQHPRAAAAYLAEFGPQALPEQLSPLCQRVIDGSR